MVDDALDLVAEIKSSYRAAEVLGISDSSVRRYRKCRASGADYPPLQDDMRDALRRATGRKNLLEQVLTRRPDRRRPIEVPDFDVDEPEPTVLLDFLRSRVGRHEVDRALVDLDLIAAAYVLARRHNFESEAYRFLDDLRDAILGIRQAADDLDGADEGDGPGGDEEHARGGGGAA